MTKPLIDKHGVPAIQRVIAFRNLNRALDMLECAYDMIDAAKLLYPGMDPKYYEKLYKIAQHIIVSCPKNTELERKPKATPRSSDGTSSEWR